MIEATPERLERRAFRALLDRNPGDAERYARALIRLTPDNATAWVLLGGALKAQGGSVGVEALARRAGVLPLARGLVERAASCATGARGLIFDPYDRFEVRPLARALRDVGTIEALGSEENVMLFIDRGGELVERHPVLALDGVGGEEVVVRYRTGPKFVASIRAAAVVGEGLVLTEDGAFVDALLPAADPAKYKARRQGDDLAFEPEAYSDGRLSVDVFDTPAFLMTGPTDSAFGDWIVNFAPRLALYEAAGLDCPILVRRDPPQQVLPLLEALGVGRDRLVFHEVGRISLFPKLYVPSWPSHRKAAPMADVFGVYRRTALSDVGERPLIYLTRRGVSARPLLNEPEVCELFAGRGFQIIDPGELSFEEVRRLFASPACVAGPFGSAFHNLVFSSNHPLSLVLLPAHLPFHLAETALWQADCGNRFAYVLGDMPAGPGGVDTPWTVSLAKVERALDRVLELVGSATAA